MPNLSDNIQRKFTEVNTIPDFMTIEIETDTGYHPVTHSNKTIPYQVFRIKTEGGFELKCADDHIVIQSDGSEIFVQDCIPFETVLKTKDGNQLVTEVEDLQYEEEMFDLTVDSDDHLYYTDGILSHNTVTVALYALHQTIFNMDYTVGFTSFTSANCKDVLGRYKYTLEALPHWLKPEVTLYNRTEVAFAHGSQMYVQVTSENALRGRTNNMVILDELAFVKNAVCEDFYTALLPSLEGSAGDDNDTRCVVISTPNGTVNKFAEIYFGAVDGSNGFSAYKVDHTKIPGRDEAWKQSMLKKMSREKYLQEFECHFLSDSGTLVNSSILESISTTRDPVETFRGDLELYVDNLSGRKLGMSCDVSEGVSKDNHCIQLFDLETFEQVGEFANNTLTQSLYFKEIVNIMKYLQEEGVEELYYTVEANSIGQGILRLIENSEEDVFDWAIMICDVDQYGVQKRMGMLTTSASKRDGCMAIKDLIETGRLTIRSLKLLNEFKVFVKTGSSFAAESGFKDDRVMAAVILVNMLPQVSLYEDGVHDRLHDVNIEDETWGIVF